MKLPRSEKSFEKSAGPRAIDCLLYGLHFFCFLAARLF